MKEDGEPITPLSNLCEKSKVYNHGNEAVAILIGLSFENRLPLTTMGNVIITAYAPKDKLDERKLGNGTVIGSPNCNGNHRNNISLQLGNENNEGLNLTDMIKLECLINPTDVLSCTKEELHVSRFKIIGEYKEDTGEKSVREVELEYLYDLSNNLMKEAIELRKEKKLSKA